MHRRVAGIGTARARTVRTRDPGLVTVKRSLRAAVVIPVSFAVARFATGNVPFETFTAFGSFALLLFVDFGGRLATRLRAYATMAAVGTVFIVVATLCSTRIALSVTAMAVAAFAVLFWGVISPMTAAGATVVLLTFVLPVSVAAPAGQIPDRLGGWILALAFSIPASLFLWPRPWHDELRRQLATTARAIGALLEADADGRDHADEQGEVEAAVASLRALSESGVSPSAGATGEAVGVAKLVGRIQWVATNAVMGPAEAAVSLRAPQVGALTRAAAAVLGLTADAVDEHMAEPGVANGMRPRPTGTRTEQLATALYQLEGARAAAYASFYEHYGTESDESRSGEQLLTVAASLEDERDGRSGLLLAMDPAFRARLLVVAVELAARAALEAEGFVPPDQDSSTFVADTPSGGWDFVRRMVVAHMTFESVWLRNSLRGAIGLALAVLVVKLTDVAHGFWVVLGTLSVLRSSALSTEATAMRSLVGTLAGFVIGAAVMIGLGDHYVLLWVVLPVAVFLAGAAPRLFSFAAGQAGFTVVVVVLFNIIDPAGWRVGLVRIEDVAIGCGISLLVGVLLWPRGAGTAVRLALGEALASSALYLERAIGRVTDPELDPGTDSARVESNAASERLNDAFRQYLAERGARAAQLATLSSLAGGITRTRWAAFTLATMPPIPIEPGKPELGEVADAAHGLCSVADQSSRWAALLVGVIKTGHGDAGIVPSAPDGLHRQLLQAAESCRRQRRPDRAQTVLRMLLADEALRGLHDLEHMMGRFVSQPPPPVGIEGAGAGGGRPGENGTARRERSP